MYADTDERRVLSFNAEYPPLPDVLRHFHTVQRFPLRGQQQRWQVSVKNMSNSIDESIRLFERYRADDSQAADELFQRYVFRLTGLVRARMSPNLAKRLDAEDVVQSAYRSFFRGADNNRFEPKRGGDLWRLLAAITLNKLGKQIERHLAAKRDMGAEQSGSDSVTPAEYHAPSREPSAEDEALLQEEVELLTRSLNDEQRQMLSLRLAGYRIEEIAGEVNRSERTVRRLLDKIKAIMQERLATFSDV